jgi:hypothetical protein
MIRTSKFTLTAGQKKRCTARRRTGARGVGDAEKLRRLKSMRPAKLSH